MAPPEPGTPFAPMVIGLRDQTGARLYRRTVTVEKRRKGWEASMGAPVPDDELAWSKLPPGVEDAMNNVIAGIAIGRATMFEQAEQIGNLYRPRPETVAALLWRGDASTLQELFMMLGETIDSSTRKRGTVEATPNRQIAYARTPAGSVSLTMTERDGLKRTYQVGAGWFLVIDGTGDINAMSRPDFEARYEKHTP